MEQTNRLKEIIFANYKAFDEEERSLELKPITVILGKNNSGKSSLLKLVTVLCDMLSDRAEYPLLYKSIDDVVELGGSYEDLFHHKQTSHLMLGVRYEDGTEVKGCYAMNEGMPFLYQYYTKGSDANSGNVGCTTSGIEFESHGLINRDFLAKQGISPDSIRFRSSYIGPIRAVPQRTIDTPRTKNLPVGKDGENVYSILLGSYLADKKLFAKVSEWFESHLLGGKTLDFVRNSAESGTYSLCINKDGYNINIADTGQGIGQVLPVITASFLEQGLDVVTIEQPVLHLHPAAHDAIAKRLAESALQHNRTYVVETHSENFLLGLRDMIADREHALTTNDVVVYFIDYDEDEDTALLEKITIDEDGMLSSWPHGVFRENYELLERIMNHCQR